MLLKFYVELILIFQATPASCLHSLAIENAVHITSSSYALNRATSVVWSENSSEEATSFLLSFRGTVVLTLVQNGHSEAIRKLNQRVGYKQTVFFASRVDEFANFMTVLQPDTVVPVRVILVLTSRATDDEISAVTKTALQNDLSDIVIVNTKGTEHVELSTYFPYSKGICGNHAPVLLNHSKGDSWFPKKFINFQGCPIRVSLLPLIPYARYKIENNTIKSIHPGLDELVFKLLVEKINAGVDVVSWKDHGGIGTVINGTTTGSFSDLVNRRADIFAPTIIVNYLRYPKAQISPVYQTVDVYWFGPHRQEINECLRVVQPMLQDISYSIITSSIIFILVTKLVIRFGFHRVYFRESVMFQSFSIFLGQEARFESKSWLVNCLFIMWIWFCMIVRIVYQGDLVDGLQKVILEKPLENLKEAVKAVDGYGGSEGFREFYRGTSYFDDYIVLKIGNVVSQLKEVSNGKRFLVAADRLLMMELSKGLQMLKEPISHAPVCFFMRPGWPAAVDIAHVIGNLVEAGFVQNILNDHIYKWMKKEEYRKRHETRPLNMQTLIGCFYGLGILYVFCVLVFIVEIVYYKLTLKRQNGHQT